MQWIGDEDEFGKIQIIKIIIVKSKQHSKYSNKYGRRMHMDVALQSLSPILLTLLKKIPRKVYNTALIENFVISISSNQTTLLQIDLSVILNRKILIDGLYKNRVYCSYNEYRSFMASTSKTSEMQTNLRGLVTGYKGLIQVAVIISF